MKLFGRVVFALPLRGVIVTIWDVGDLCVCVDCNRYGVGSSSFSLSVSAVDAAGALQFQIGHVDSNQYRN